MASLVERLGYAPDAKLVIISCDDLGSCHASNVGVYQAIRDGIATCTSIDDATICTWLSGLALSA